MVITVGSRPVFFQGLLRNICSFMNSELSFAGILHLFHSIH